MRQRIGERFAHRHADQGHAGGESNAVRQRQAGANTGEAARTHGDRHQIEIDIAPFKGLLIGVFFITVGMTIDVGVVWTHIGLVLAAVVALLALKAVILMVASRAFGVSVAVAVEVAILLAQGGEFAFIVITLARLGGVLSAEMTQIATAVVGISMMVTPL